MPWWGWALIALAVIVAPIKLKVLKSMMSKNKQVEDDN